MLKLLVLLNLLCFSSMTLGGVYGKDDRYATYLITNQDILRNAYVGAALINKKVLEPFKLKDKSGYLITMKGVRDLCPTTRFAETIALSHCSGALIAPNSILSAGHCVSGMAEDKVLDYDHWVWVLDFKTTKGSDKIFIPNESVVEIEQSSVAKYSDASDFVVFKLKDSVPREPSLLSLDKGEINYNEEHYMIGHPTGLPQVVTKNGFRMDAPPGLDHVKTFFSNLDAFKGNSGSPVYHSVTNEIIGILVQGKNDYIRRKGKSCDQVSTCPESGCARKKVDGSFIPETETVYKISAANHVASQVYEYEFRSQFEYALEHKLYRYIEHALEYMDSIPYDTYMMTSDSKSILEILINADEKALVDKILASKRLTSLSFKATSKTGHHLFRYLSEENFIKVLKNFSKMSYFNPSSRQHLIFDAISFQKTKVAEQFIISGVHKKFNETEKNKLRKMLEASSSPELKRYVHEI